MARKPVNIKLSEPIKAHGQTMDAVTLRPLTAKDLRTCGSPFIGLRSGGMRLDAEVSSALIAVSAGIPPSSVDMMDPGDFYACERALQDFLSKPTAPDSQIPVRTAYVLGKFYGDLSGMMDLTIHELFDAEQYMHEMLKPQG